MGEKRPIITCMRGLIAGKEMMADHRRIKVWGNAVLCLVDSVLLCGTIPRFAGKVIFDGDYHDYLRGIENTNQSVGQLTQQMGENPQPAKLTCVRFDFFATGLGMFVRTRDLFNYCPIPCGVTLSVLGFCSFYFKDAKNLIMA